ncbi:MAG: ABC transporter ATP-binding protein [Thermodesulfobacteriota bacterium]
MALLELKDIHSGYEGVEILHGVSLTVEKEKIYCIIGPNGSGKSTLLKTIFGFVKPKKGKIFFDGNDITGHEPEQILRKGMCYVLQRRSIFPDLSVKKNLKMGAYIREDKEEIRKDMEGVFELFPVLKEKREGMAGILSGGEQRMLEFARALMVYPKLILLDEPSAGLAPKVVKDTLGLISEMREKERITFLIVEQKVRTVLEISDYGYVVDLGRIKSKGNSQDLLNIGINLLFG